MNATIQRNREDDVLAELTDIAYRASLRQGLTRSFVEVELELWAEIRRAFRRGDPSVREHQSALVLAAS